MPTSLAFTVADWSAELSVSSFYVAAAIDGTGQDALQNAVDGITLGVVQAKNLNTRTNISGSYPTSELAQRELKLLIGFTDDTTGKKYTTTIPAPDISLFSMSAGSDFVDITNGAAVLALVTAMETYGRSELGNNITVNYMKVVGRNN